MPKPFPSVLAAVCAAVLAGGGCATASGQLAAGRAHEAAYRVRDAEAAFRGAVRADRDAAAGWCRLVRLALKNGEHGKALLLAKRAAALPAATAEAWELLALVLARADRLDEAAHAVQLGLAAFPGDDGLRTVRAEIDFRSFVAACRARIAAQPRLTLYRKQLANALLARGYEQLALREFEAAAALENNPAEIFAFLGQHFLKKDEAAKAEPFFERLVALDPRHAAGLEALGDLALERDDAEKARQYFFRAALVAQQDGNLFEKLGYLTLRTAEKDKGREFLEKAAALGVKSWKLCTTLGQIASAADKREEARRWFEQAEGLAPAAGAGELYRAQVGKQVERLLGYAAFFADDPRKLAEVEYQLSVAYLKLEQPELARPRILAALRLDPASWLYTLQRGIVEKRLARVEDALAAFRRCLRLEPGRPEVWYHMSRLYAAGPLADPARYRRTLDEACARFPRAGQFRTLLAEHFSTAGDLAAARGAYRRALALGEPVGAALAALERRLLVDGARAAARAAGGRAALVDAAERLARLTGPGEAEVRAALERALAAGPDDAGLRTRLGEAWTTAFFSEFRYECLARARAHLAAALALEPRHGAALAMLARLASCDHADEARTAETIAAWRALDRAEDPYRIEDLAALHAQGAQTLAARCFALGKILWNKNRDGAAVDYLKKALLLAKRDQVEITVALGSVFREQGRYRESAEFFKGLLAVQLPPGTRHYASLLLLLGNLQREIAAGLPHDAAGWKAYAPDGRVTQAALDRLGRDAREALDAARGYYQQYIGQNFLMTHIDRGHDKIRSLAAIGMDREALVLRVAAALRESGDRPGAVAALEAGLALCRTDAEKKPLWLAQAALHDEAGDHEAQRQVLALVAGKFPDDWRGHYRYGRFLLSRGQLDLALRHFESAAALRPADPEIKPLVAFLLWRRGDAAGAAARLEETLKNDERNLAALYYLARVRLDQGDLKSAAETAERLVQESKRDLVSRLEDPRARGYFLDALSVLARAAYMQGDAIRALRRAEEGLSLDMDDAYGFRALIGDLHLLAGRPALAEDAYRRALAANPGIPAYRYKLARALLAGGKSFQALRHLEALVRGPQDFEPRRELLLTLARLYRERGAPADAEATLRLLVGEEPHRQEGWLALADLLKHAGRRAEAGAALERALAAIKDAPRVRDALAWLLLEQDRDLARALHLAMENATTYPDEAAYKATLSYVYFRLKQYSEATVAFHGLPERRAAALEPLAPVDDAVSVALECARRGNFRRALALVHVDGSDPRRTDTLLGMTLAAPLQ